MPDLTIPEADLRLINSRTATYRSTYGKKEVETSTDLVALVSDLMRDKEQSDHNASQSCQAKDRVEKLMRRLMNDFDNGQNQGSGYWYSLHDLEQVLERAIRHKEEHAQAANAMLSLMIERAEEGKSR